MSEEATPPTTALVIGGMGQDGYYLSKLLSDSQLKVVVAGRNLSPSSSVGETGSNIQVAALDVREPQELEKTLDRHCPQFIFNLAGFSNVGQSWENIAESHAVNFVAVKNMVREVIRFRERSGIEPYLFHSSSSEVFGGHSESPQDESLDFAPITPYGEHKAQAHLLLREARRSEDLRIGIGILYNHESPRRPDHFVSRRVTKGVAKISLGLTDRLELGSLQPRRDWGFAGDYVRAMWLMAERAKSEDYVIATGESRSVGDLVQVAFDAVGIARWRERVELTESLFRPIDPKNLVGDSSKALRDLGWAPEKTFSEMIYEMVHSDINSLRPN